MNELPPFIMIAKEFVCSNVQPNDQQALTMSDFNWGGGGGGGGRPSIEINLNLSCSRVSALGQFRGKVRVLLIAETLRSQFSGCNGWFGFLGRGPLTDKGLNHVSLLSGTITKTYICTLYPITHRLLAAIVVH